MADTEIVFGIDLGTTYSCIAYVDDVGKAVVLPNIEGEHTTPSVVQFDGANRIVGQEAKNNAELYPDDVISMVKRQMGKPGWIHPYDGVDYTAEEISSYILRKLVNDAEQYLDKQVKEVVITCPAYFGIAEREATRKAGEITGLKVRQIINEPTAAAIMYGLQNESDQVVLVYDLGGGTFDVTVIEIKSHAINVIATGGDHNLGGRNWDEAVVEYLTQAWMNESGSSNDPLDDPYAVQDLFTKAEGAKKSLSGKQEVSIPVSFDGKRVGIKLSRNHFDELTADKLERTIEYTKQTMETARTSGGITKYDQLLLVGGSTKMPQVVERLQREFPDIPQRSFEPDEAVAKGAAMYAEKLMLEEEIQIVIANHTGTAVENVDVATAAPEVVKMAQEKVASAHGIRPKAVADLSAVSVTNITSHSFGIIAVNEKDEDFIANIILAGAKVPASETQTFVTLEANQQSVDIQVLENNIAQASVKELEMGTEIVTAELRLPPNLPVSAPIDVTFALNAEGRLDITAREPTSGREIKAEVQIQGISKEELVEAKARATGLRIS